MRRVLCVLTLTIALAVAANASTITVTGSGTWDANGLTTAYSAPGASWGFSFLIPDTISDLSTQATSFNYSLGGVPVTTVLGRVDFGSLDFGGLFQLDFVTDSTIYPYSIIDLYGNQAYSGTSAPFTLLPGVYEARILYGDLPNGDNPRPGLSGGSGTVTLSADAGSGSADAASVPEPATWLLLAPALALLGLRRARRGATPVPRD